jgi:hypothetical protein
LILSKRFSDLIPNEVPYWETVHGFPNSELLAEEYRDSTDDCIAYDVVDAGDNTRRIGYPCTATHEHNYYSQDCARNVTDAEIGTKVVVTIAQGGD